ncbi:ArnT family glycosyltransferase [Microbispora bryophytorum]|uniref:ArnT family glycosyltransferase n=1 Tax=Microbispora bryophytorum TaxID=1460882 RepID=UPI0033D731B3
MHRSGHSRGRTRLPSEREAAGRALAAVSVVPALALSGWLLAGLPLLLLGSFRPLPMALLGGAAALLLCAAGLRRLPVAVTPHRWATAATLAVALGSGVFNGLLHGEQLIVRRDPSTYAQYAVWLARHGSLPIPVGDFGGPDPALRFDSMGVYMTGGGIVPQFMAGSPMTYAIGHWLGGVPGLLLVPPVLGALAVLTVAGTAARLAGARWAPLAALVFAVSLPILYTSRTTFSEIPSLILLFGGMNLLLDARARLGAALPGAGFPSAALAGLSFGLALLVRIDGLRDVLPVLALAGVLIALRRTPRARPLPEGRLGVPLLTGLVVGGLWGFAGGYVLAQPYLEYLSGSLIPLLAICAVVVALTVAGTALAPWIAVRGRRLLRGAGWLPNAAAVLVVLVMAGFAVRPWVQTVRRDAVTPEDRLTADFIEKTQVANGLAKDMSRLYYEHSLDWVFWYVGIPAVVLATMAAAVLVRRLTRGGLTEEFGWLLPLAVIGWTTVTTLWRPAITPDHPFASRRLVPIVIPGLVLLAVWGLRWLSRRLARTRWFAGRPGRSRAAVAAGALLLAVPPAITSIGTAFTPVNRGEAAAVAGLCRAIPPNASVLIAERVTGDRLTQVLRGQCGLPTARVVYPQKSDVPLRADVLRLAEAVRRTGRVPVLLAAEPEQLMAYGPATRVMSLHTRQDERSLVDPPNGTWSLTIDVWMTELTL